MNMDLKRLQGQVWNAAIEVFLNLASASELVARVITYVALGREWSQ